MELTGLGPRERRALARALRRGEPVRLRLRRPLPPGVRLDEWLPLFHEVVAEDAELARLAALHGAPPARPGARAARVTAVIPCSRGRPLGVEALLGQDVPVRVLVLSNGPDGPREVPGADVVRVEWRGHGPTRRAALDLVDTPWVLFAVDDVVPLGAGCVRTLVEAMEDGGWDAVHARQLPWPDAPPEVRRRLRAWTPAGTRPYRVATLDHVFALHRADTLRRHPLPDVPIAEDAAWSRGRRVACVPGAPVLHSHPRRPLALFRRERAVHAELVRLGRPPAVPDAPSAARALAGALLSGLPDGPGEAAARAAEVLGQWLGARAAAQGGPTR